MLRGRTYHTQALSSRKETEIAGKDFLKGFRQRNNNRSQSLNVSEKGCLANVKRNHIVMILQLETPISTTKLSLDVFKIPTYSNEYEL